jgi:hypothetical protein
VANQEHLAKLAEGVEAWNVWRADTDEQPDLRGADLSGADLSGANLDGADLVDANLCEALFCGAQLSDAQLRGANLTAGNFDRANLRRASLRRVKLSPFADLRPVNFYEANLSHADLYEANLSGANLYGANLSHANLSRANLSRAKLKYTTFQSAIAGRTRFENLDLRAAKDLETIEHTGPSEISISTLIGSEGKIPELFLRGCGVPDIFIEYIASLGKKPIHYFSCFISYSTKDQDFATRLYNDLQANDVRCWFAPHDMEPGKKIHEQIDAAIRVYDKLLLILSPNSMQSEWVETEISKARKRETSQGRRMLFPVRTVDFESIRDWECFDADVGKDSAKEIREFYIPDFSNWASDHASYSSEFEKLLKALKSEA